MLDWIKDHPYLTAGLAIGAIVLFSLLRRSNGTSDTSTSVQSSGPSESLQSLSMQTGAAIQVAQLQANAQQSQLNAQVNVAELGYAYDLEKTKISAGFSLASILQAVGLEKYRIDAEERVSLAQVGQAAPIATTQPYPTGTPVLTGSNPPPNSAVANLPGGAGDSWTVVGSGGGQIVHGVELQPVYGMDRATEEANQRAIEASYANASGSYLGNGIFAHTPEAWATFGDPSISYSKARELGYI